MKRKFCQLGYQLDGIIHQGIFNAVLPYNRHSGCSYKCIIMLFSRFYYLPCLLLHLFRGTDAILRDFNDSFNKNVGLRLKCIKDAFIDFKKSTRRN